MKYPRPNIGQEELNSHMSDAYWQLWNDEVQQRIDRDIETHRKADAVFTPPGMRPGAEVKVEQLSHDFIFGAHIFNFNQLGSDECNRRHQALFGDLFNSATIPFYWKKFEMEEGHPRFAAEYQDSAEYWNQVSDPKNEPHWRRPATDPVVDFCESKGIRLHGHTLSWGNYKWQYPAWLLKKLPARYHSALANDGDGANYPAHELFKDFSAEQLEELLPDFTSQINAIFAKRIMDIALRYRGRIHSWDVVNESATDFSKGLMQPGSGLCKSSYGLMPGDYSYRSFKIADGVFPKDVKLNINDYFINEHYRNQVQDLLARGCKIDIAGIQMHLFNPQQCLDIAAGKPIQAPQAVWDSIGIISEAGLPLHLSEITITAPGNDERGQAIQAVITRNLYRLWFSIKAMMGITWWNSVDDCGAPGEPSVSGIFTREMNPKLAFFALDKLINHEWRSNLNVKADQDGAVAFRGFRGNYRLSWQDDKGQERNAICALR
jgi:endo-1,4-beta-xylanase